MKRIKIKLNILCFVFVFFDLTAAGSLKQLWNKLKYENRLDYYQPYSSFNYLPTPSINYPAALNNYNLMNIPVAEPSNLHRSIIPVNNLQTNLQNNLPNSLQPNLLNSNLHNVPNLMTAESALNQNYAVLPQMSSTIQNLSPDFLIDYGQKPNSYLMDSTRNLNGINSGISLTSLTPLLLLSSLGTLSSKSLAANPLTHGTLTPVVSNGFLKGLTTYLSSYLPSSPRQRKRQIDRSNLPTPLSSSGYYSFKKMTLPIESYIFPLRQLTTDPKISSNIYDESSKKYSHFTKKKPIKYMKPKWVDNKMHEKLYNAKKRNHIKYSKLMTDSNFVNHLSHNNTDQFTKGNKLSSEFFNNHQIKYSDLNQYTKEKFTINKNNSSINKSAISSQEEPNRSNDQQDNQEKDKFVENKLSEDLNEKLKENSSASDEGQNQDLIEENQPHINNLEDIHN